MNENRVITFCVIGGFFLGFAFGFVIGGSKGANIGYKQGQIDYATGKIEYTIQDGRTIQYLDGKE